jgi:PTS system mannose-specific IID component
MLRSFFLQACWNFQRMQNIGFCFAISPVLRAVYPAREAQQRALKRHLEFFNTHPYCASIILGVVAKFEERAAQQGEEGSLEANRIKTGMMGPLAALGDTVFWSMLKPALSLLGVGVVLVSPVGRTWPAAAGPLLFLALFSVAHLGLRAGGIFIGYQRGIEIVKDLRQFNPQLIARRLSFFIAVMAGTLMALVFTRHAAVVTRFPLAGACGMGGLVGLMFMGLRRGLSATHLFYALVGLAILAAYLGL